MMWSGEDIHKCGLSLQHCGLPFVTSCLKFASLEGLTGLFRKMFYQSIDLYWSYQGMQKEENKVQGFL